MRLEKIQFQITHEGQKRDRERERERRKRKNHSNKRKQYKSCNSDDEVADIEKRCTLIPF